MHNELQLLNDMEKESILQDSTLSQKYWHTVQTGFQEFFENLDVVLEDEACVDPRPKDSRNYCYQFISMCSMIKQISSLLPPRKLIPSERYLPLQFTNNDSRDVVNSRDQRRFNITKKMSESHVSKRKSGKNTE